MDSWTGILLLLMLTEVFCVHQDEVTNSLVTSNSSSVGYTAWDDLCSQLPDGAYPDYNQACRMFFICTRGKKAATFWCTKGFVFSLNAGHCEPPDRAMCPDFQNPSVLDTVVRNNVDECLQGDGLFPDYTSGCSSFYMCKGSIKSVFSCPGTSLYDWRTKTCRNSNSFTCNTLSCTEKEDGLYIDSNSYCKRYFECSSGNVTEYVCPEGTIYNARHHRCTRSSTTRCFGLESVQCTGLPDGYYPDYTTGCKVFGLCMNGGLKTFNCPAKSSFNSKTLTCETSSDCPKLDMNKCTGKSNGIHPNFDTGCRDFYLCLDGLLTHQGSCPMGKLLNPMSGNCQPSSLVTCSPFVDTHCDGLPDGVYPDFSSGCSSYFICLNRRLVSTAYCQGTDLFDIATGKCLPSSFVICRDHSSFVSSPRLFDSYNCDNRLGVFPEFSSDCRRYVTCAYGQVKFFECGEGMVFDQETNSCRGGSNSNCKAPFAIATFQCLPGDDGVYIGPNCTEWHECRNGIGFSNLCPRGMQYDLHLGKCVVKLGSCTPDYAIHRRVFHSMDVMPNEIKDSSFECPTNVIGVFSDTSSCRKFHFCAESKKASYECPFEFAFDHKTQSCIYVGRSDKCEITRFKRIDNRRNQDSFSCTQLENGMYADFNSDCRRYYVCENGNGIPVYCPEKQKFSSIKMMCDREKFVTCQPQDQFSDEPPFRGRNTGTDDMYHVYGPSDTYTDASNYDTRKDKQTTNSPKVKSEMWNDYDLYSNENVSPSSTDRNYELDNSKVPNSINSDADSSNKRHYPPKRTVNHQQHVPNLKLPILTTVKYDDPPTASEVQPVAHHNGKLQNKDFEAACRKGDTGFSPDYESGCKMFHICFRSIRKIYSCPSVLLFNPETKNCDLPENVQCTRPEPVLETSFDCRRNINKFVVDPDSGCRNYIGCIHSLPYRFTCPQNKIFSTQTSMCEFESSTTCEHPPAKNVTTHNENDGKSQSYRHVHGIPGQFYFSCTEKPDGFYPDYIRHCHVFYRCVRGKKFSHYCKQGLLFNPQTGICDFEENVKCSSASTSTVT